MTSLLTSGASMLIGLASATRKAGTSTWLFGFTSLIFVYLIAGGSHDGIDGEAELFH